MESLGGSTRRSGSLNSAGTQRELVLSFFCWDVVNKKLAHLQRIIKTLSVLANNRKLHLTNLDARPLPTLQALMWCGLHRLLFNFRPGFSKARRGKPVWRTQQGPKRQTRFGRGLHCEPLDPRQWRGAHGQ